MSLKKIAEISGVSVSTVSLVLAGKGRISAGVRERVLNVARDLNYKRPLYAEKNRVVAVLHSIDKEWKHVQGFISGIIAGLEEKLSEAGFSMVLVPIYFTGDQTGIARKIRELAPVAVCSIHYISEELFTSLEQRGIPVIIINRSLLQDRFCTVCVDDFQGAYEGGKYLLEQVAGGNVIFLGYAKSNMTNLIDDRAYGFQKAVLETGSKSVGEIMCYIDEPLGEFMDSALRSLWNNGLLQAVYAYDDYLAAFAVAGLERLERGLSSRVLLLAPGDTLDYTLPFTPQLTTMAIDTGLLGRLAAEMVCRRTEQEGFQLLVQKVRQQLTHRVMCGL